MASRMHLKNGRGTKGGAYERKGTTSSAIAARGPNLIFEHMVVPVPEIMDGVVNFLLKCITNFFVGVRYFQLSLFL
jgi:hypothetical protein